MVDEHVLKSALKYLDMCAADNDQHRSLACGILSIIIFAYAPVRIDRSALHDVVPRLRAL